MIWKVAWRNVWRSRTRTFVVIGAVVLAIWALVFMMAFIQGVVDGYIAKAVQFETAHIQVHNPAFLDDQTLQFTIPDPELTLTEIDRQDSVNSWSARIVINAMMATAKGARGIQLRGIDPIREDALTHISQNMIEGAFFASESANQIVISTSLAEKLNVGLRKKVVVTFQDQQNELITAAFRVSGLFDTNNKHIDDIMAYIRIEDLRVLAGLGAAYHEIALLVNDIGSVEPVAGSLAKKLPATAVRTFEEIAPDLALFRTQVQLNLIIMTVIIMLALIFGIINTMLMAVLERTRELGMLMAIGMNKVRVFGMVVIETLYVSLIGAPIGILLGWVTVTILNKTGIDLSLWSSGLSEFGMATLVRPSLGQGAYAVIVLGILITALLASIYPSLKAIRLRPVQALRKL